MDSITPTTVFHPELGPDIPRNAASGDAAPMADAAAPTAADRGAASITPGRIFAAAIGAGAVSAAVVGAALYFLLPPQRAEDPRLPAISRDVEELKQQVLAINDRLRTLDTGAVSAAETIQELKSTVRDQTAGLAAVQKGLSAQEEAAAHNRDEQSEIVAPALMGVAVVQLREAVDRGLRFDWELVNLWGVAGRQPEAAAELNRLTPLVRGVQTERQIKDSLRLLAVRWDYGMNPLRTGINAAEWLVGIGSGTLNTSSPNAALLYRAMTLMERDDYLGVSRELRKANGDLAGEVAPVITAVEARATALSACGRLMVIAKRALEAQARTVR
jgi:hypothetical protein